ncbi:MAG: hypothetical protein EPN86_00455 [Nanoarchaeota archaeon]|nr:MAG: hypothetical protein EPN86_00455 [Nanoarchaeota archaeon]
MKKNIVFAAILVAMMLTLSGCFLKSNPATSGSIVQDTGTQNAQGTGNTGSVKEVHIEASNFQFTVTGPEIKKGDRVKLILTSAQGTHGFAMPAFNIDVGPISPGDTKTAEFVADQSGSFDYFCNVPCGSGHQSMKGILAVS